MADRATPLGGDIAFFLALLATALALGAALAHGLELPNKMALSQSDYFTVQKIYAGWHNLAYLLAVELASIVAVIFLYRDAPPVLWPALTALGCLIAAQVIFSAFTFPANQATQFWTMPAPNWESLRRHWEYSHLAGALFQVLALMSLIIGVLSRRKLPSRPVQS